MTEQSRAVGTDVRFVESVCRVLPREAGGAEPVRDFLDDLDDDVAAVLAQQIDRLNLLSDESPPAIPTQ